MYPSASCTSLYLKKTFIFLSLFLLFSQIHLCKNVSVVFNSRWTLVEESDKSGMAVLEVDIPTGYVIQQQELDAYVLSGRARHLREARYDERKVSFYFNYVSIVLVINWRVMQNLFSWIILYCNEIIVLL